MKRSRSGSSGEFARRTVAYSAERISTTQRQGPMWPTLARFDWSRMMRRICRGLMDATGFQASMDNRLPYGRGSVTDMSLSKMSTSCIDSKLGGLPRNHVEISQWNPQWQAAQ